VDTKVRCLYLALCQPPTTKGQLKMAMYISEFFDDDDAVDFASKCAKPGNYLYGEYMKEKINAIKDKINGDVGGILI
jgi:hypothetical protein